MPSFQYITKTGVPKNFDAADQESAARTLSTLADRDPASGVRLVSATLSPAPVVPGTGISAAATAPAAPNYSSMATSAGEAGLSYDDYSKIFAPTDEESKAAQDTVAQQFGYTDYQDFITKTFSAPSQTTTDFYSNAYSAAGLDKLTSDIAGKKNRLNEALGTVNDNPWYDEAFRRGEASRLQQLAGTDIQNLQDDYQLRLGHVHDLVTQHASDLSQQNESRKAQLQYLEKYATDAATRKAAARASEYLSNYEKGKQSTQKPATVTAPGTDNVYQYDPVTGAWNLIQKAVPKPVAASTAKKTSAAKPTVQQDADQMTAFIENRIKTSSRNDHYLSPMEWKDYLAEWVRSGRTVASFNSIFGKYKNPNDKY